MNEREIFAAALDIADAGERAAYLNRVCETRPELRQHLGELLAAQERLGGFLVEPAGLPQGWLAAKFEDTGSRIGPYRLLQPIGEGGMGVVYMAEQEEPVRRKVALKIIKPGMDSRQVIARFEAERQALAMMDHLNIAKVFDAGTTESGRPYFVMELVYGVPITAFCDGSRLTPRERLALYVPVCQAIQHAHQKGVIHRDVKPSNVLVTMYDDKPVPKVIDFGVAKAVEQQLTQRTMFTHYGTFIGTLEYMSPEQAEMNALGVDTRSDIYSLGVLLYELLTGTTPLERQRMQEAGLDDALRWIKEEESPRPSERLIRSSQLARFAAARRLEPARLPKILRGEIDWIVMKCLEKDRSRRYETVNALARDIERYLNDEPVEAGPPSAAYRLRKLARKHRRALAVAGGFIALLAAGTAFGTFETVRAIRAEREIRDARSAAKLYREALLQDPKWRELPMSDPFRTAPLIRLAKGLLTLDQPAEAEIVLRDAVALRVQHTPDQWPEYNARALLGASLVLQQKYAEAEPLLLQAHEGLERERRRIPRTTLVPLAEVLEWLVKLYDEWGKPEQAKKWRERLERQ